MFHDTLLRLSIREGDGEPQCVSFGGPRVTFGKAPDNTVSIPSVYLSRYHGEFIQHEGGWLYRDLGSTNGTRVQAAGREYQLQGERGAREIPLRGGERILAGDLRIDVALMPVAAPTPLAGPTAMTASTPAASIPVAALLPFLPPAASRMPSAPRMPVVPPTPVAAIKPSPLPLPATRPGPSSMPAARPGPSSRPGTRPGPSSMPATPPASMPSAPRMTPSMPASVTRVISDHNIPDPTRGTRPLEALFEGFLDASIRAIEARDPSAAGHAARVAACCLRVADAMNRLTLGPFSAVRFTDAELRTLRYAALLHDFGNVGVRDHLLTRTCKLPETTLAEIRGRFRAAGLEARARAAEEKVQRLLTDRNRPADDLLELDRQLNRELAWLEREETWLLSQLGAERIADRGRLEQLTKPLGSIQLLEPRELEAILSCRGTLSAEERKHLETHAHHTRTWLERVPWPEDLRRVPEIAGSHHEKLNGTGYPRGLDGSQLALETRILTVCDLFDALTADRPYRAALSVPDAINTLKGDARAGTIDGEVVKVLEMVIDLESGPTSASTPTPR